MKLAILLSAVLISALMVFSFDTENQKKKIIFLGDSITQQAVQPGGYIERLKELAEKAGIPYELEGAGVSGDKVYDLYLRLEPDVIARSPDIVVIYVGVNDVWHKQLLGTGTDYEKFGRFYQALVARLRSKGIDVVVCTPAVIGERTDNSNEQDGDLNYYSGWIRQFAAESKLPLADLRAAFVDYNLKHNKENRQKGILTTDRVHLNGPGNELVATVIWKAIRELQ